MDEWITLQFDGGSRGNPGPAGIGVVLRAADDTPIFTLGRFIGRATNNVAEYSALVTGLQKALEVGVKRVLIRGDSELVIKQMKGVYRVKHPDMKRLFDEAQVLVKRFAQVKIEHNLRHKNELADALANQAMDKKRDVTEPKGAVRDQSSNDHQAPGKFQDDGQTGVAGTVDEPEPVATREGDRFACGRCQSVINVQRPSGIRPHQLKPYGCQCGAKMKRVDIHVLNEDDRA